jgi:hypothetical protein
MANIDEDLSQIERDIRVLKIEYEQYFGGGRPRPPADTQWRVDQLVKRHAERGADMNYAQRFRYNNLVQTYAKYQDIWRKKVKQKEEGVVQRHFGAAAKAVEAERQRNAPPPPTAAEQVHRPGGYVVACSNPDNEKQKVEALFKVLVEAKQEAGESTSTMTLESFQTFVKQKTAQLRAQKGCQEVEYAIQIEAGQVRLKARVKA